MRPTLSVLIVSWNSREQLARTLPALLPELGEGDELIVVDNDSADGTPEALAELAPRARLLRSGRNAGFAAACDEGAALARGELLVILNPDAAPLPGFGEAIRRPWVDGRGWAAWQALVAARGATEINSAGNPVHFTGLVWAGGHGRPIAEAPPPGEVTALSGACLAIPRETWERQGGFPAPFFLYHEDVDLSLRLRLGGGAVGIEPAAVVDHDYDFGGGGGPKWRWLERNRWACPDPRLPGRPAGSARAGAPGHRAGPDPGLDRRRVGEAEAAREPRCPPLAAPPPARAPPIQAPPQGQRGRVRQPANPRPRLALHPSHRPLDPGPPAPPRLLARGVPAARSSGELTTP